jgi:hypothetical protein
VPFFEPLPPEPELEIPQYKWGPPLWDRPSEAILGAPVAIGALLAKTDVVALALTNVQAYPNGFTFALLIAGNPMRLDRARGGFPPYHPHNRAGPRIGLEFADGRRATAGHPSPGLAQIRVTAGPAKDNAGIPTVPVLTTHGGGGSQDRFQWQHWCFPLPPAGPIDVYVEWASEGVDECKTTIDGDAIRNAAVRAITLWEPQ